MRESPDVSLPDLWAANAWRPIFAKLRAENPVSHCPQSAYGPYWSIVRHNDVIDIENDPERFSSASENGGIVISDTRAEGVQLGMFIAMDGPEHARKRKVVSPAFTPSGVKGMAGSLRQRTGELLDRLPVGQRLDWVRSVSIPLTTAMIATLFDFPWEERHKLSLWSDWVARFEIGDDTQLNLERERQMLAMAARFGELYRARGAASAGDDLLSIMAHSDAFGVLDRKAFMGAIALLLVGGNDTTRHSMSGLIEQIDLFPEAWARVKADPARLASGAATETIRLQTPLSHMRRTATRDVELHGKSIRKGDKVVLWYNSGNRDEAVFPDPDRWDPARENSRRHLSFGHGVHRCLGARLAELQVATLVEEMARRNMEVRIVGEPERLPSCFINEFERMPVEIARKLD
ncbi:MAG: cytochrome P450 [Novosphingobium sp.]